MPKKKDVKETETKSNVSTATKPVEDTKPDEDKSVEENVEANTDTVENKTVDTKDEVKDVVKEESEINAEFQIFVGLRLKDKDTDRGFKIIVNAPAAIENMWTCSVYSSGGEMKGNYNMHQKSLWAGYVLDGTQITPEAITPEESGVAADRSDT